MDKDSTFEIKYESRNGRTNILPFSVIQKIKESILGKKYELSVVFATATTSKKLNKKFRNKNYPTNILSFPNTKQSGEIFLHVDTIKQDAPNFNMSFKKFFGFLFIHGCLHLEGLEHGSIMEGKERAFAKKFGFS